ncbi:FNBP1 [Cordylochernes scorpioides]|uniref:FNBP1 n=1 Tax=Cordylochernes scorpioides TaxID=51811 RepID=A0ABY6KAY7_9ARAC|nr:FNBP1 [Cordylochernes scorpioides]
MKDQYDNLASHTLRGLGFLERYSQFIKERSTIEAEYATKLRKLVKHYMPKKKGEEEDSQFTSTQAFVKVLNEVNCIAGQHEVVAENLVRNIALEVGNLAKEIKNERKKYLSEGARLQTELQNYISLLEKAQLLRIPGVEPLLKSINRSKRGYEKAYKESEKAHENYVKANADINLSRAEVEKSKMAATFKSQLCEQAKAEYATQLQKTNDLQRRHYAEFIPNLFQQLQDMDERRTACLQNYFRQAAHVEKQVLPIVVKCLDDMMAAAEAVDPKTDSRLVIERYKSGFQPQDDFPFEDIPGTGGYNNNSSPYPSPGHTNTLKGTVSGRRQKRSGLFGIFAPNKYNMDEPHKEDFSDLPPNQRRKKLNQKIDAINQQIGQANRSRQVSCHIVKVDGLKMWIGREGLLNLKEAYVKTPSLGDATTLEHQLADNSLQLEKLRTELSKYQGYLREMEGGPTIQEEPTPRRASSLSEEDSLSRSASDSSVAGHPLPDNRGYETPVYAPSSDSPESGIALNQQEEEEEDDQPPPPPPPDLDVEPLPVLGNARALYPFEATSDGSISIYEGEEFEIVELDQGDGWTRVRKANLEEGFVPSSYIDCYLFNNCWYYLVVDINYRDHFQCDVLAEVLASTVLTLGMWPRLLLLPQGS